MRLINADELYELLDNGFDVDMDELPETKAALLEMIAEQPTVEKRKTGKWIHGREIAREMIGDAIISISYEDWKCSACGRVVEDGREPLWKFCPSCGARMEVVK